MKKLVSLLLLATILTLALVSCGTDTADDTKINVGYFPGSTGIGLAKMIHDADTAYTFSQSAQPTDIQAKLVKGELDIAAYPTNGVPNLSNAVDGGVQYLALNTLGVLYLCTNGVTISTLDDLAGKTVYVPEMAPKLVLDFILRENDLSDSVQIEMSSLDDLPSLIVSGQNGCQIALLPEPKVTAAAINASNDESSAFAISPVDITAEWNKVSDQPLVQGCLVVRTRFAEEHPDAVRAFLAAYEKSIQYMQDSFSDSADQATKEAAAQMVVDANILPKKPIALKAIPRSNVTYIAGNDMKSAVLGFLSALNFSISDDAFFDATK